MDGILPVWKPEGWTSHDVVAKTRRIVGMKRIGHAGTLDPMVTGVLPLCLGRATRVVEYIQERPKAYEAVLKLGIATDTEDMTGEVVQSMEVPALSEQRIEQALSSFVGQIEQVPPMYSAVKVDGKRLYELAREGKTVERKSRQVDIYEIKLLEAKLDLDQPEIRFSAVCSKGTYIRTLCVDIGKALQLPATMASLIRTMSAGITRESCLTMEQIEQLQQFGELEARLMPADEALTHMAKAVISVAKAENALRGHKIPLHQTALGEQPPNDPFIRLYDETDRFIGIYEMDGASFALKPVKVFS